MGFQRIPSEFDLSTLFSTLTDGAAIARQRLPNFRDWCTSRGVQVINVGGRPMLYRHELLEAIEREKQKKQVAA